MVVAQLVRAPDCGSGGRRFETDLPPRKAVAKVAAFFVIPPLKRLSKVSDSYKTDFGSCRGGSRVRI